MLRAVRQAGKVKLPLLVQLLAAQMWKVEKANASKEITMSAQVDHTFWDSKEAPEVSWCSSCSVDT